MVVRIMKYASVLLTLLYSLSAFCSWSIDLIAGSLAFFYGNWKLFIRSAHSTHHRGSPIPSHLQAEDDACIQIVLPLQTINTMFQTLLSILKLLYFLLAPRKFYELLRRVYRHELLLQCKVFGAVSTRLPFDSPLLLLQICPLPSRCVSKWRPSWIVIGSARAVNCWSIYSVASALY